MRRTSHVPLALDRRPRAPSGATRRGGLPLLSLERPQAGPLLACRRRRQCARPLALCPPLRAGHRQGRRRQMDRRRHGRPWRSARSHPAESAPRRCPRGRRRSPSIPQPAGTACRPSKQRAGRADRWRQTPCGTTAMGHDAADRRHPRRRLPRRTRHHRPRRHARKPAFPPVLLPPPRRRHAHGLPRHDRFRHRRRLHRPGPPPHLARSRSPDQGAHSRPAPGHGHASRPWRQDRLRSRPRRPK